MQYFEGLRFVEWGTTPNGGTWKEDVSPFYALHFCVSGRILCALDGKTPQFLEAPSAWWSLPMQRCAYGSEIGGIWRHQFVFFEGWRAQSWYQRALENGLEHRVRFNSHRDFGAVFNELLSELNALRVEEKEWSPRAVHIWERLLIELGFVGKSLALTPLELSVQNWIENVRTTPQIPCNVAEITRQYGVTAQAFSREVKNQVAVTPYRFVTEQRLDLAALQMRETRSPITAIAIECGFTDFSYFRKLFFARYKLYPTQYRQITRLLSREISKMEWRRQLFKQNRKLLP